MTNEHPFFSQNNRSAHSTRLMSDLLVKVSLHIFVGDPVRCDSSFSLRSWRYGHAWGEAYGCKSESSGQVPARIKCLLIMRSLPPSLAKNVICKVLVVTYPLTKLYDTDDYFAKKFSPLAPLYIMSRSYKMVPKCEPQHTLFDCWKDRFVLKPSTDHNLLDHLALLVMLVSIDVDLRAYRRGPCSCLKIFAVKLCLWETSSRCLFWSTEFFLGESHVLGFTLDLLQDLIRGWWVKNQGSPLYSYKFMVYPSLCIW